MKIDKVINPFDESGFGPCLFYIQKLEPVPIADDAFS